MEERAFSPEQSEEVIELLDIVESSDTEESAVQVEESGISADAEREEAPFEGRSEAVSEEETSGDASAEQEEQVHSSEKREAGEETAADMAGEEPGQPISGEEFSSEVCPPESGESDVVALLEERLRALEERHESVVRALEERLAASEKACAELSENVESLSQQIAQAGAMFLEDASVRLNMEEMVSRMLDARMPAGAEQEEGAQPEQGLVERMDALERRMADEEARGEQMAAAAAVRVIRDEIAAMRAEAASIVR